LIELSLLKLRRITVILFRIKKLTVCDILKLKFDRNLKNCIITVERTSKNLFRIQRKILFSLESITLGSNNNKEAVA